jgi:hypothetical protein
MRNLRSYDELMVDPAAVEAVDPYAAAAVREMNAEFREWQERRVDEEGCGTVWWAAYPED